MGKLADIVKQEIQAEDLQNSAKLRVVRQDRFAISDMRMYLTIFGENFEIINYSSFGVAVESTEAFPDDYEATECDLVLEGFKVCSMSIKKVREEFVEKKYRTAFEITSEPLSIDRMKIFPEIWRLTHALTQNHNRFSLVPVIFKARVYELKDILQQFEKKVNDLFTSQTFTSKKQAEEVQNTIVEVGSKCVYQIWQIIHNELASLLEHQLENVVKESFSFFREQLKSLIYQSPFADRSFTKPLGYAGDYEMMNLIYNNADLGHTLFAKCIERCFLDHPEPQAVRNRVKFLTDKISETLKNETKKDVRILSVASGPAMEVQKLLQDFDQKTLDRLDITLLDQDINSLKHVQLQLKELERQFKKRVRVSLVQKNIKTLVTQGFETEPFDLIYSAGLFDYFNDQVANIAAKTLYQYLRPGKRMIIGNFDLSSPNRFGMSAVFDWNLIYRSQEDLERIYNLKGAKTWVDKEKQGINLFCIIEKPDV